MLSKLLNLTCQPVNLMTHSQALVLLLLMLADILVEQVIDGVYLLFGSERVEPRLHSIHALTKDSEALVEKFGQFGELVV